MAHLLLTCFLSGWIMSIFIQSLTPDTWESCLISPSLILPVFSLSPCAIDSASNLSCFSISINQVYHNLWVPLLQKPHSLHHPLQTPPIHSLCSNQCDFFSKNKNLVMSHCCLNSSLVPHYFYEVTSKVLHGQIWVRGWLNSITSKHTIPSTQMIQTVKTSYNKI